MSGEPLTDEQRALVGALVAEQNRGEPLPCAPAGHTPRCEVTRADDAVRSFLCGACGEVYPDPNPGQLTDEQIRAYLDQHPDVFREFLHREVRRDPAWLREYLRKETRIAGGFPFERLD